MVPRAYSLDLRERVVAARREERLVDAEGTELLAAVVREQNDRTLEELGALNQERRPVRPSRSALFHRLIQLGLGRNKVAEARDSTAELI